jgi:hypothetical protein
LYQPSRLLTFDEDAPEEDIVVLPVVGRIPSNVFVVGFATKLE